MESKCTVKRSYIKVYSIYRQTPYWAHIVCPIGLFIYQILDALDGKQAVKVQDTPIEEVYDHGCDAVSALFITQSVAIATQLGHFPLMQFTFFIIPLIAFYMTHFSCHITHVMVFGRYLFPLNFFSSNYLIIFENCNFQTLIYLLNSRKI